jgi:hypothetical protein
LLNLLENLRKEGGKQAREKKQGKRQEANNKQTKQTLTPMS